MDLIKVKVGELSTFVDELTADSGAQARGVVDGIVRVYYLTTRGAIESRVHFRAGYRSRDEYVYLEEDIGSVYDLRDDETHPGKAREAVIRESCDALGLDFRHGVIVL